MNKVTLLALLGVTSTEAHPHFFKMLRSHHKHHGHHGHHKHHGDHEKDGHHKHGYEHRDHKEPTMYTPFDFLPIKGKVPEEKPQCEIDPETVLEDSEFYRELIGGTYKNFVKGWYQSDEAKISDDCLGEWMIPMIKFQKEFHHQVITDPMSTSIEDAHTWANNFVDLHWRNRDSCEISMVKDDYYNWCLDNEEVCLGADNQFWTRMYKHGYDIFGKFYDLAGIMFFENDECYTDTQMIDEHNRVVEDLASLMSYVMGFNLSYDPERVEPHYTKRQFHERVYDYIADQINEFQDQMEIAKNSQKDYFGAEGHGIWMPTMPTQDDINEYIPDTPSMSIEIDIVPEMPEPVFPQMPLPTWEQMPQRPKFPPPPRFPSFKNVLKTKLF